MVPMALGAVQHNIDDVPKKPTLIFKPSEGVLGSPPVLLPGLAGRCPLSRFFPQHTHYPQFGSQEYTGQSLRGPFGDALLEFDGSVGHLLQALQDAGVEENTLVFFTADNG